MPWAVAAGLGVAGALAGSMKQGGGTTETTRSPLAESALGKQSAELSAEQLKQMQELAGKGPGGQDVTAGLDSQRSLADMMKQYSQGGYQPNAQDISQAQSFTQSMFAPQQEQQKQAFEQANMQANRQAARMGRAGNDPILQNKLLQEQTRQQATMGAQQQQFMAQYAQNIPQQRLGYAQQYAGIQSGLASQAMANRQALFSMGQQALSGDQNFRTSNASQTSTAPQTGGGIGGAIMGGLAGAGVGAQVYSAFSKK